MPRICLNAIVKNEADKVVRWLTSLAPYIDYAVIVDTGSTDATMDLIETTLAGFNIDCEIHSEPFENFEQARNAALDYARKSHREWDYLMLCDADMELVVEDKNFRDQLQGGSGYDLIQKAGTLSYHNRRFISRAATGKYRGVTHEFLDVAGTGLVIGAWFVDHADGANRGDKYKRDIRLLKQALKTDPNNARSWYYLGQSYRDAGKPDHAAEAYKKCVELDTWDEEKWSAKVNLAHCLKDKGDVPGFVAGLIDAYNFRPSRAEPLYDLANHYRLAGQNRAALLAAEEGLRIPLSKDALFVQEYAYTTGLPEEFSITAYYDPARRSRGADMCNRLSLDKRGTWASRDQARNNLFHYIEPLCVHAPSFTARRIAFTPPDGYIAMNPSITNIEGNIICNVRSVNYSMDEQGRYLIKGTNGEANGTNPIHTRNFLLNLNEQFNIFHDTELLPPEGFPAPAYNLVVGFEDVRLFARDGDLYTISNVREQNDDGWCEQTIAPVLPDTYNSPCRLGDPTFIRPQPRQHEKNWMPWPGGRKFVYNLGTFINDTGAVWYGPEVPYAVDGLRGGSQVIDFLDGYLAIVHSAHVRPGDGKRYYQHRFVRMNAEGGDMRISKPFVFHDKVIEFAAGMAWHPDNKRILISYGREDKEAWIATVSSSDIVEFLHG